MITVHAVGDLVLETTDAAGLLAPVGETLRGADVVIGHLEIPHLEGGIVHTTDVAAVPGPPSALDALADAGFDILTLAGNHVYDFGPEGIRETRRHCEERGMQVAGVGETLDDAFAPALVSAGGVTVAVVSINCVGPRETWATSLKPGAAYVDVVTHYEPRGANPGGPPRVHSFAEQTSLARAVAAVRDAASAADVVIVALHKGLVHEPARIADYEREVSHAMVDAGAQAVVSHHAHIGKGIEIYRGRPILHGLGNFATVTRALALDGDDPGRAAWARERRRLFGFEPDPAMPTYPFHPESRHTMIAALTFDDGAVETALIPCWIDDDARPVPVGRSPRGEAVADYLRTITADAAFATDLAWSGDRLVARATETP
ncbi:CapA family protein [Microbacterium sp. ET2]|uniref:CapA family protein n=1 Tax=Microbacterium albipurpureum TaxID=3050384 RepID=UPI00259CE1DF|nr:CapA family protein [Microbacterium sp. ET2 (Ac-2212)]WJL94408.1 CapA family protein [Microbacterium sp. ET2 (Ac-2212)]